MTTDKGYVIRCLDLFDGSVYYRGMKETFAETKSETPIDKTYTISGAKRALSNVRRLCLDPDRYQYNIERLDEFYVGIKRPTAAGSRPLVNDKKESQINTTIYEYNSP